MANVLYNFIVLLTCIMIASGSYLGYPRINFAGFFRADAGTRNNEKCNYHEDYNPDDSNYNMDWGFNGTNEFEWFESKVTTVFDEDGNEVTDDPVLNEYIVSNLYRPYAKLVDLDVDCQFRSTIYGMKFGITEDLEDPEDALRFSGKWTRSVVAQDMWSRIACYGEGNTGGQLYQDSFPFGAMGTTLIEDIDWNFNLGGSTVLQQLKDAIGADGKLAVRVALTHYTRNLPSSVPYNATLGYVSGTIGVPSATDTLNIGGQRVMLSVEGSIPVGYDPASGDLCYNWIDDLGNQTWVAKSPFEVNEASSELRVDFASAFSVDLSNTFINIGTLQLAIQDTSVVNGGCIQLLINGEIPYLTEGWMTSSSGIFTVSLSENELQNLLNDYALLVVQVYDSSDGTSNICGEIFSTETVHMANILAEEPEYYIRPKSYYVDRLVTGDTSDMSFYVTRYGNPVQQGYIRLVGDQSAISYSPLVQTITSDGLAEFTFTANTAPPIPREYTDPPCPQYDEVGLTLPLDGNIFLFEYQFCSSSDTTDCLPAEDDYAITFLYFSDVTEVADDEIDWVHNVGPILSQFAKVAPAMNKILDMSDYNEVILHHNKELMKLSLSRPFEDPGYMPTTRDLSPAKRVMLLKWLNQDTPLYDRDGSVVTDKPNECIPPTPPLLISSSSCVYHPRCDNPAISNKLHPGDLEPYFLELTNPMNVVVKSRLNKDKVRDGHLKKVNGRPLMGLLQFLKDKKAGKFRGTASAEDNACVAGGVPALQEQLQTAMSLEFATLPVYLTSLYSIVDGCNQEIYDRIRSVAMQEMVHFAQAANLLISIGKDPVIDDPSFVPSYPTPLPGEVLPGLTVSLKKLSLDHVKDILMAIEVPVSTTVGGNINPDTLTIGALYEEINSCMAILGEDIFSDPRLDHQIEWPWTPSEELGEVRKIANLQDAQDAISMIVEQGEGSSQIDPTTPESDEDMAHFFKFEEIVCQNELVEGTLPNTYSYSGAAVPFNAAGVWNMRDHPRASDIRPNTNCYTEARAFHQVFRNLLRSLHALFNDGDATPAKVKATVLLMESLQVHGKKTMWTKFSPSSYYMCGPVWDYDWPADE